MSTDDHRQNELEKSRKYVDIYDAWTSADVHGRRVESSPLQIFAFRRKLEIRD